MNSRYHLTFKSTFQPEKPKKLENYFFNVKIFDWDYLYLTAQTKENYFTMAVSQERSTVMTFASPIFDIYYSLFIKNPADILNIMAYIEPMHRLAWISMFVLLATVPPLLYLAVR